MHIRIRKRKNRMRNEFETLLYILKYAAFGEKINIATLRINKEVFDFALRQDVLPLVYATVAKNPIIADAKSYKHIFFAQIIQNEQQLAFLKNIVEIFEKNNINYCVLKGASIAALYHLFEYRFSGDVDILINQKDEKFVMNLLEDTLGFSITPRAKEGHHFLAQYENGVLFEIHTSLYGESFDSLVLKNLFIQGETYGKLLIKDGLCINTLSVTDNLYFLTAHLIKHFVKEGCGIRQVTDLLVFVKENKDRIDFKEYFQKLEKINFDVLIKNIFGIGEIYFSLDLPYAETKYVADILEDIQNGGSFGFSEEARKGFFDNFLVNRTRMDEKQFSSKMTAKQSRKILRGVFFPSRSFLISKGYHYLKKSILLYPVAYVQRVFDAFLLLVRGKRSIGDFKFKKNENKTISERMKLMEELQMFGGIKE